MVPVTGPTHLDDMDGELCVIMGEPLDLSGRSCGTGHLPESVTENPRHQGERFLAADRTGDVRGGAVERRGREEIRIGVAHLAETDAAGVDFG